MTREFEVLTNEQMNLLRNALDIKEDKCYYCGRKIDFSKDKFQIWNKPTRVICNSTLCTAEAMEDDE